MHHEERKGIISPKDLGRKGPGRSRPVHPAFKSETLETVPWWRKGLIGAGLPKMQASKKGQEEKGFKLWSTITLKKWDHFHDNTQ